MFSVVVLACYLACAAWLASSVYRAGEHAAHGRRIAGIALGLIALVLHAVLLWRGLFDRPVLSFTIAETASLIGWPIEQHAPQQDRVQHQCDDAEREPRDATAVGGVLAAGARDAGREPRGASQIARKNDDG